MCSGWISLPSAGQYILRWRRTWSWSWRRWKRTRVSRTAVNILTGMFTRPKLIVPDQIERAAEDFSASGMISPLVLKRAFLDDVAGGFVAAEAFEGGLLDQ